MADPNQIALQNTLLVALCRPAMMLGVPAEGLMCNLVGTIIGGAWFFAGWRELVFWLVAIPTIHMIMRVGVSRDHNWFRVQALGMKTKSIGSPWGGWTATPIASGMPRIARDLPIAF